MQHHNRKLSFTLSYRSPISERCRETIVLRQKAKSGQASSTRTLPRPKSLFMETTDVNQLKKYRSVVQLKSDPNQYQQRYISTSRSSPTKAMVSPTHERVQRKRLSSQDEFLPLVKLPSSEYYSMTHSSEYSDDNDA